MVVALGAVLQAINPGSSLQHMGWVMHAGVDKARRVAAVRTCCSGLEPAQVFCSCTGSAVLFFAVGCVYMPQLK
jgi:hypothetical protein